jgi:hypothetical protein
MYFIIQWLMQMLSTSCVHQRKQTGITLETDAMTMEPQSMNLIFSTLNECCKMCWQLLHLVPEQADYMDAGKCIPGRLTLQTPCCLVSFAAIKFNIYISITIYVTVICSSLFSQHCYQKADIIVCSQ